MKNLALKRVKKMSAYLPPLEGRQRFKGALLDFNERTAPLSAKVVRSLSDFVSSGKLLLYPEYEQLEEKLAIYSGVKKENILTTNGSDQAIDIIFRTFAGERDSVIIPEPSFPIFAQAAKLCGSRIIAPAYCGGNLDYPLAAVLKSIDRQVKLIVVCNPNNPTGTMVGLKEIELLAKSAPGAIIMVDEAYYEFNRLTAAKLTRRYPNVIVTRTFSKAFGLPALRLGYIIANRTYITELLKARGPYAVNMAAYTAGLAALAQLSDMRCYAALVMKKSKPLVEKFLNSAGIKYFPSGANFILFKPQERDFTYAVLQASGIRVRPQKKPGISDCLRVTIGTPAQMRQFIKIYKEKILPFEKKKVAFIDRDGTIIHEPQDTFQIDSLQKLKILKGVTEGLQLLKNQGYQLVMVSNQDGLGTKSFPKRSFLAPQNLLLSTLKQTGIEFQEIFVCPHFKNDNCSCRKPKIGLLKEYLKSNHLNHKLSFVCGDRRSDHQLAANLKVGFAPMKLNGNFYTAVKKYLTETK